MYKGGCESIPLLQWCSTEVDYDSVAHRRRTWKHVPVRGSASSLSVLDTGTRPFSIGTRPSIGRLQRAGCGWQLFHCIHCGSPSALIHSARRGQIARLCKHHSACHQHGGSNCSNILRVHHSPNLPLLVSIPTCFGKSVASVVTSMTQLTRYVKFIISMAFISPRVANVRLLL